MFKKAGLDEVISRAIEFPSIVQAARDWAMDCQWGETEIDDVNEFINGIEPRKLLKLVDRHYDGGLPQLIKDNVMERSAQKRNNRVADVGGAQKSNTPPLSPLEGMSARLQNNQFDQKQIPDFVKLITMKKAKNLDDDVFYYFAKGLRDENFANNLMAYYKLNPLNLPATPGPKPTQVLTNGYDMSQLPFGAGNQSSTPAPAYTGVNSAGRPGVPPIK